MYCACPLVRCVCVIDAVACIIAELYVRGGVGLPCTYTYYSAHPRTHTLVSPSTRACLPAWPRRPLVMSLPPLTPPSAWFMSTLWPFVSSPLRETLVYEYHDFRPHLAGWLACVCRGHIPARIDLTDACWRMSVRALCSECSVVMVSSLYARLVCLVAVDSSIGLSSYCNKLHHVNCEDCASETDKTVVFFFSRSSASVQGDCPRHCAWTDAVSTVIVWRSSPRPPPLQKSVSGQSSWSLCPGSASPSCGKSLCLNQSSLIRGRCRRLWLRMLHGKTMVPTQWRKRHQFPPPRWSHLRHL